MKRTIQVNYGTNECAKATYFGRQRRGLSSQYLASATTVAASPIATPGAQLRCGSLNLYAE
jgi:hypothetical protein